MFDHQKELLAAKVPSPAKYEKSRDTILIEELFKSLCSKHQISIEQFYDFLSDPEQFEPDEWQQIQEEHKKLNDALTCTLDNIANPVQTEKKYKELEQMRHWIPMR